MSKRELLPSPPVPDEALFEQVSHEVLPPQHALGMLLGSFEKDAAAKNKQLGSLLDALASSVTQTRTSYERELETLHRQLELSRADRDRDLASFETRVSANLQDIRAERDYLRVRVRELELARDGLVQKLMNEKRQKLPWPSVQTLTGRRACR